MDETTATILLGCQLAKDLEANLSNMANQPELLTRSCDEIIRIFTNVKERISMSYPQMAVGHEPHESQHLGIASGVQEWLKNSHTQAMDLFHAQNLNARSAFTVHGVPDAKVEETEQEHTELEEMVRRIGGKGAEGSTRLRDDHGPEASNSARALSTQRQGRRRYEGEKRTVIVPAPRMGNTEIPPEDGYTWRKYGQKDILNSNFPRSYFRCPHQKLYHCPAKKEVQRLDDDPSMFEVIYKGRHTCHLSATAPAVPSPSLEVRQDDIIQQATADQPLP